MDRQAVVRAFINLLDNAIKFSKEQKRIVVHLRRINQHMRLEVEDFGIGIPEQEQKRIFEKFYRVEGSLVHNTKGSGLGLTLVAHIMSAHGGRVEVQSRVEAGSIFTLVFPLAENENLHG
jgi:two-component system phosphate regulon sensor histidine kinase PhoR